MTRCRYFKVFILFTNSNMEHVQLFRFIILNIIIRSIAIHANECDINSVRTRIVGGIEPNPNSHPWAVALLKNDVLYCGATVISKSFMLTAAHCIYFFDPAEILVLAGGHRLKDRNITRRVRKVMHHDRFDVVTFNNDIGLLEIDIPLMYGLRVKPACLPSAKDTYNYSGELGLVSGWGRDGEQSKTSANVFKYIYVPIWPQKKCLNSGYGTKRLTNNMMCAGFEEGRYDACQGDSGGSMLRTLPMGAVEVIGIISWGRGCARPNFPGIYTIVGKYNQWLRKHLSDYCQCDPQ